MFDVIGKRRWFFLFSALLTLPGLVFILMTPITNGAVGLQFSIDYTGGTDWEIRFADASVTSDQVKAVLIKEGVGDAEVLSTSDGYYEIRTKLTPLATPPPAASPSPSAGSSAGASPGVSSSPGQSASPSPSPALSPAPTPIPSASSGSSPGPSPSSSFASVARSPSPSASPSAAAGAAPPRDRVPILGLRPRRPGPDRRFRPPVASARSRPPCRSRSAPSPRNER